MFNISIFAVCDASSFTTTHYKLNGEREQEEMNNNGKQCGHCLLTVFDVFLFSSDVNGFLLPCGVCMESV